MQLRPEAFVKIAVSIIASIIVIPQFMNVSVGKNSVYEQKNLVKCCFCSHTPLWAMNTIVAIFPRIMEQINFMNQNITVFYSFIYIIMCIPQLMWLLFKNFVSTNISAFFCVIKKGCLIDWSCWKRLNQ